MFYIMSSFCKKHPFTFLFSFTDIACIVLISCIVFDYKHFVAISFLSIFNNLMFTWNTSLTVFWNAKMKKATRSEIMWALKKMKWQVYMSVSHCFGNELIQAKYIDNANVIFYIRATFSHFAIVFLYLVFIFFPVKHVSYFFPVWARLFSCMFFFFKNI